MSQITAVLEQIVEHRNEKYFEIRDQLASKIHFKLTKDKIQVEGGDLRENSVSSEGNGASKQQLAQAENSVEKQMSSRKENNNSKLTQPS